MRWQLTKALFIFDGMKDVDAAIAALADPTRRRVVELLVEAPRRTNELAELTEMSVPAISRHLRVLRERGVIERADVDGDGRGRQYRLDPQRLDTLSTWLNDRHWAATLSAASREPDVSAMLERVGGFLDGFAAGDAAFFQRHLADDVELIFPGSLQRWDKDSTVASVAGHAPYVEWTIESSTVRPLAPSLTIVTIDVAVRTTENAAAASVTQTMIFDDTNEPWTLRFLQQTPG